MNKVIVFGIQDFAELAHYYLTNDSAYDVVAFTVHKAFLPEVQTLKGLPIVAFETIEELYPVKDYLFFVPMDPKQMNTLREAVYLEVKHKGYQFISYISSKATVLTDAIGDNCFILEDNTIQPFVEIGNCVVMWSGNHIGHHSIIKDYVNFTSHVVLSGHCTVEAYSFFGVNAAIRDNVTIAEGSFVGMSAAVVKDTEAWGVYIGNPAKRLEHKHSKDVRL